MEIRSYTPDYEPAVKELNRRLAAGNCPFRFSESARPRWLPPVGGDPIFEEYFLAAEGEAVRGAYVLKHQPFRLAGEDLSIGYLGLPLSEGVVDKKFHRVGTELFADALKRQPLMLALGMGGLQNPLPRFLKVTGWTTGEVPFFFLVTRPRAFLRNIVILRRRKGLAPLFDFAAATGLGSIGGWAYNLFRRPGRGTRRAIQLEQVREFAPWTDEIWTAARGQYHLAAIRTAAAMNRLYPPAHEKYLRLKISAGGATIGWALALDTQMSDHKQFGAMRLGSVIDCMAVPGREFEIILAATHFLEERGVDLIVTNQMHRAWQAAFQRSGYLSGPSNFVFAAAPKLGEWLAPFEQNHDLIHITRADGEGPTHL